MSTSSPQDGAALYPTWQSVDEAVKINGGVLRIQMIELRKTHGVSRLKTLVVAAIERELANLGIGHLPPRLPGNQTEHVVLYKIGEPAGAVINAVLTGANTESAEQALRRLNTSDQVKADSVKDAKLSDIGDKIDELQELAAELRTILDEQ